MNKILDWLKEYGNLILTVLGIVFFITVTYITIDSFGTSKIVEKLKERKTLKKKGYKRKKDTVSKDDVEVEIPESHSSDTIEAVGDAAGETGDVTIEHDVEDRKNVKRIEDSAYDKIRRSDEKDS